MLKFFCRHREMITVAVWNLDPQKNDFGGLKWDGAYTNFCVRCKRFSAEIKWPTIKYLDGERLIRQVPKDYGDIPQEEWGDESKWHTVTEFCNLAEYKNE